MVSISILDYSIYALLAAVFISSAAVLSKAGSKKAEPSVAAGLGSTVATICAFLLYERNVRGFHIFSAGSKTVIFILLTGFITGLGILFFFKALHIGAASNVVPVTKLNIIITILFGVVWWHNKLTTNIIISAVLCILGLLVIIIGNSKKWQWFAYAIISAVSISAVDILENVGVSGVNSGALRFYQLLIATVFMWILAVTTGGGKKLRSISFLDGIYSCLSGVTLAASWVCLSRAQALNKGILPMQIYRVNLLITLIAAAVLLKEKISGRIIVGGLMLVAGLEILLLKSPIF